MDSLKILKKQCDDKYFNKGDPCISDYDYDLLENLISDVEPEINTGIAEQPGKFKLPIQMWSLDKVREFDKIKYKTNVVLMEKLDGVSCLIYKGKIFTRGNGIYGTKINVLEDENITKNNLLQDYAIRGEILISKQNLSENFACTRTMVCSFVNRNQKSNLLEFVAYELISLKGKDLKPEKQLKMLKTHGYKTVENIFVDILTEEILLDFFENSIQNSRYDIDGIVINYSDISRTSRLLKRNPKHSIAFKKNFKGIPTRITDIIWTLGKTGKYNPVLIVDPIKISGSVIKRVTGHNLNYLETKKIGIGSEVEIIKSGQIIPHVCRVITESNNFNIPKDMNNIQTEDVRILVKKFHHFGKILNIKGMGLKTSEELQKITCPKFLVENGTEIISKKFKGKKWENLITNINNSLRTATDLEILVSLEMFGPNTGIKNAEKKLNSSEIPDNFKTILDARKSRFQVKPTIKQHVKSEELPICCVSGTRNKEILDKIIEMGYSPKFTITKKTRILFVIGNIQNNVKIHKAEEYNIPVIYPTF